MKLLKNIKCQNIIEKIVGTKIVFRVNIRDQNKVSAQIKVCNLLLFLINILPSDIFLIIKHTHGETMDVFCLWSLGYS